MKWTSARALTEGARELRKHPPRITPYKTGGWPP